MNRFLPTTIAMLVAVVLYRVVVAAPAPPDLCTTLGGHSVSAVDDKGNPVTATISRTFAYQAATRIKDLVTTSCTDYQQQAGSDSPGPMYSISCSVVQQQVYEVLETTGFISATNPTCPSGATGCYASTAPSDFPISTSPVSWDTTIGGYGTCADQAPYLTCSVAYAQWERNGGDMTRYVPPTVPLPALPAQVTMTGECCVGLPARELATLPPLTGGAGIGSSVELDPP